MPSFLNPSTHAMRPALPLLLLPYDTGGDTREEREREKNAVQQIRPRLCPALRRATQRTHNSPPVARPRMRTMMYSSPRQLVGCPHRGLRASRLQTSHWQLRRLPRSPTAPSYN